MAIFDSLQNVTYDISNALFGEVATWTPETTGIPVESQVFFNSPSKEDKVSGVRYFPFDYEMEYRKGKFDGLLEIIREGQEPVITIKSVEYIASFAETKHDGNSIFVCLKEKP